jgi:hypothetical protein
MGDMGDELDPQLPQRSADQPLLHPASGLAILGLDWLLFSGTVISGGGLLPAMVAGGFVLGGASTWLIQSRLAGDSKRGALWKALAAGALVGAPMPIGGTIVGATILSASGLRLLEDLFRGRSDGS